ncbi:hypothetical protein NPIL_360541 [Nephila pilipes]|uniref:Uncharacterized protein n=1 Tax=Nephila pilipes TaxID=299642 RepID=A0A8X6MSS7_NEPPI|nr:hypothetical protein NPIL_360541 [Nephila pilipes]
MANLLQFPQRNVEEIEEVQNTLAAEYLIDAIKDKERQQASRLIETKLTSRKKEFRTREEISLFLESIARTRACSSLATETFHPANSECPVRSLLVSPGPDIIILVTFSDTSPKDTNPSDATE